MTSLYLAKKMMVLLALILSAVTLSASTDAQPEPMYFAATDLRAGVARTQNGLAATVLPAGLGMKVYVVHRDAVGEAEVHASVEDMVIVQAGEGDFLLGGRVEGNREVAPDEWRGGKI